MPFEATHAVLAQKFLQSHSQFEKRDFLVGTLFPDIRYLGSIDREKTHQSVKNITEILEEKDSFLAGVKFHVAIDELWTKQFVMRYPQKTQQIRACKILQDREVFPQLRLEPDLFSFAKSKKAFLVSQDIWNTWFDVLRIYFFSKPTEESIKIFFRSIQLSDQEKMELLQTLHTLEEDADLLAFLRNMIPELRI